MNEKEQKQAIKQLFKYRKKAMSKNATELDVLRYNYYAMEVAAGNLQANDFDKLIERVLDSKFKFGSSIPQVASKLMQARLCPAIFYNEEITHTSPTLLQDVKNRSEVLIVVENSNWNKRVKEYFKTKNIEPEKLAGYTKALMLMEQIGLENTVVSTLQKHTKSKYPKFIKKVNVKGFFNKKMEIDASLTKAKIAILGGQEKYDQLMKILNKEVPFTAEANKILQEALKLCNGFGQLVNNLNSSINSKIAGDYRVAHQFQVISKGKAVPNPPIDGNQTMGNCVDMLSTMLKIDIVDSIYDLQAQNGIYYNPPQLTQVQEKGTTPVEIVAEDPESDATFTPNFMDVDTSEM